MCLLGCHSKDNVAFEIVFDSHENEHASKTHSEMNGFAPGLVSKQSQKKLGNGLLTSMYPPTKASNLEQEIHTGPSYLESTVSEILWSEPGDHRSFLTLSVD